MVARTAYSAAPQHEGDEDEHFAFSAMCCDSSSQHATPDWKYVGQGRGGYEKLQNYSYVGQGAGSFQKEEIISYRPTLRPRSECICLLLATLIMLFLWAAPHLWRTGGSTKDKDETSQTLFGAGVGVIGPVLGGGGGGATALEDVAGSCEVVNVTYQSLVNHKALAPFLAAARRGIAKEAGTIIHSIQPRAVNVSIAEGFDKSAKLEFVIKAVKAKVLDDVIQQLNDTDSMQSSLVSELTDEHAVLSAASGLVGVRNCGLEGGFAAGSSQTTTTTKRVGVEVQLGGGGPARPQGSSSTTTPTNVSHDCDADYTDCYVCLRKTWSSQKLAWCCEHAGKGCETTTTSVVYNCLEGFDNWRLGWSSAKKEFCCAKHGKGCHDGSAYKEEKTSTSLRPTSTSSSSRTGSATTTTEVQAEAAEAVIDEMTVGATAAGLVAAHHAGGMAMPHRS